MNVMGQTRPISDVRVASADPRTSDITLEGREGRNGPLSTVLRCKIFDGSERHAAAHAPRPDVGVAADAAVFAAGA
jgi:hypothetical protein